MNAAEAAYQARQCRALFETAERAVARLLAAVDPDAPPSVLEPARLLADDAQRLTQRSHYVVRLIEQLGPNADEAA